MTILNHTSTTVDTVSTETKHSNETPTRSTRNRQHGLRNKMLGALCGATLMMGAFSFMPTLNTSAQQGAIGHHHTVMLPSNVSAKTVNHNAVVSVMPVAASYQGVARQAAINNGINPDLFVRQIQQESGFNPNAVSPVGARGIAQFMPATAAAMGVNTSDPVSSLNGAARLMADLSRQFGGDYAKALAAYNAGPGAVQGAVANGGGSWLAQLPGETQHYVQVIMG